MTKERWLYLMRKEGTTKAMQGNDDWLEHWKRHYFNCGNGNYLGCEFTHLFYTRGEK